MVVPVEAVVTRVPAQVPMLCTWNICEGVVVPMPTLPPVVVVVPLVTHCAEAASGRHKASKANAKKRTRRGALRRRLRCAILFFM
jgi:hypothetical protein